MRILRRNLIIFNEILFVLLSFVFMHIIYSLDIDSSAFETEKFVMMLRLNPVLTAVGSLTILSIYSVKKVSLYILPALTLFIFYKTFSVFLIGQDKIHLLLNVLYVLVSYNMVLLLNEELGQALYSPCYVNSSLDVKGYMKREITINSSGKSVVGNITNFDEDGVVINFGKDEKIKGNVTYEMKFEGVVFKGKAKVFVQYKDGIAIKVETGKKGQSERNWKSVYDIISRRSYC